MVPNFCNMEKGLSKIITRLSYNRWNIGIIEKDLMNILFDKTEDYTVNWVKHNYTDRFFADPFIYSVDKDTIKILVEELLYKDKKGRITLLTVDRKSYVLLKRDVLLEQPYHLSYPFISTDNDGNISVMPEASMSGEFSRYSFDGSKLSLVNQNVVITEPLCDATIVYYQNQYYLFGTKRSNEPNCKLYIYYSDNIEGPYVAHKANPVLVDSSIARPAGAMFVDEKGQLYRVSQKNDNFYGETVNLTRIDVLDHDNFSETLIKRLPKHLGRYKHGFHTINSKDGLCVVDGYCKEFAPLKKLFFEIRSRVNRNNGTHDE